MPRGKKKAEPEVKEEAVVDVAEQPEKRPGRKPKSQQETKPVGKRPTTRKTAKTAEAEEKPKRKGGRPKANDKAAPAEKKATKKNTSAEEKPKRKYVRKTQKQPVGVVAAVDAAPAPTEATKEEIIDKIISTDIASTDNPDNSVAKVLLDFNEEEAKALKAFVKALVAAQKE